MPKAKEGQVTIFIIIGILIIAVIGFIVMFVIKPQTFNTINPSQIDDTTNEFKTNFEECLHNELDGALYIIALQGGYFIPAQENLAYTPLLNTQLQIPYYIHGAKKEYPTKEQITSELEFAITEGVTNCVEQLDQYNTTAQYEATKTKTKIDGSEVTLDLTLPITITQGDTTTSLSTFTTKTNSAFTKLYETAVVITSKQDPENAKFCITCLEDLGDKTRIQIDSNEIYTNDTVVVIYSLRDVSDPNILFNFAHKFEGVIHEQ